MNTKHKLTNAMFNGTPLNVSTSTNVKFQFRSILSIELEDGSLHSFNVTGYDMNGFKTTQHIVTAD